ncbi:hypothetical protein SLS54_008083 [Diplodia seriata]
MSGQCELKLICENERDGKPEGAEHIPVRKVKLSRVGLFIGSYIGLSDNMRGPSATNLHVNSPLVATYHVRLRAATDTTIEILTLAHMQGTWLNGHLMVPNVWYEIGSGAELRLGRTNIIENVIYYAPRYHVRFEPVGLGELAG